MSFSYDSLIDSLAAFLRDGEALTDPVRDDARVFLQSCIGSHVYIARRPQLAGSETAIVLEEVDDDQIYHLLNEDEFQLTIVRLRVMGRVPRVVRQIAEAVRRLLTNFCSSGDSTTSALWGDLAIVYCARQTGWFVQPHQPGRAQDAWTFEMASVWRIGYDAVVPAEGGVDVA